MCPPLPSQRTAPGYSSIAFLALFFSDLATAKRVFTIYLGRRIWSRLFEKGGKWYEKPCYHNLELPGAYIERAASQAT